MFEEKDTGSYSNRKTTDRKKKDVRMKERYISSYPDVLTLDEARMVLGVGRNVMYDLLRSGQIRSLRIGKQYRIPKHCLVEFLGEACYDQTASESYPVCTKERRGQ